MFKAKKDFIPLIVTIAAAFYFIFENFSKSYVFSLQQMSGLILLGVCLVLFVVKLRLGVLVLGLYFLLGWTGLVRLSSGSISHSVEMGDSNFIFYHAHPLLFWLMIFHLTISWKHYIGIGTKKYWQYFFKEPVDENDR